MAVVCLFLAVLIGLSPFSRAQPATAFVYQGRLTETGGPVSGLYDFRFQLFTSSIGGGNRGAAVNVSGVAVTNGLFTTPVEFGAGVFDGVAYWLEVAVKKVGPGTFVPMSPRQLIAAVPNAVHAASAQTASTVVADSVGAAQLKSNSIATLAIQDSAVTSPKIASGQVVKSINGLRDNIALVGSGNVSLTTSPGVIQIASAGSGSTTVTTGSERPRFAWFSGSATTETMVQVTNSAGYLQQLDWLVTQFVPNGQSLSGAHSVSIAVDDDEPQVIFLKNAADTGDVSGSPQAVYRLDQFGDDQKIGTYYEWDGAFHFTRLSFTNRLRLICHFPSPVNQAPVGDDSPNSPRMRGSYVRAMYVLVK